MQLVNDHTLCIRLFGERKKTLIGQHYTLFAAEDMSTAVFEERFAQLQQTFLPCSVTAQGVKHLTALMDPYVTPTDQRSAIAAQALESLSEETTDPSAAFSATMFALDMLLRHRL